MALLGAVAFAPALSGCDQQREAARSTETNVTADANESGAVEPESSVEGPSAPARSRSDRDFYADAEGEMAEETEAAASFDPVAASDAPASGKREKMSFETPRLAGAAAPAAPVDAASGNVNGLVRNELRLAEQSERLQGLGVNRPEQDRLKEIQSEVAPDDFDREGYDAIPENRFLAAKTTPLSTFAVDVDTASYANVRRFLNQGVTPPPGAVRIEELVNYFRYDYAPPTDADREGEDGEGELRPFAVHTEVAACPWQPEHRLVRVGLKGREMAADARPLCNLVFLLDVSGSMNSPNKLGLVKQAMSLLTQQLGENDKVSIVVYASASGLVLPPTSGDDPQAILDALNRLSAGGSTNGGQGIELAYHTAVENYIEGGVNRVILCTDGDFNVGVTDDSSLVRMIEQKAKAGVSLTVLGFGMGNYQDSKMEQLADKGDGNYGYIDNQREAQKMLVEQLAGTLVTIAKDVKIQVEFNPAAVGAYRLIGYENRKMAAEDFRDDAKDAGEIGAGHTVTALYEVVPAGLEDAIPDVGELKYQTGSEPTEAASESGELLTVRLRYKAPNATKQDPATEFDVPVQDATTPFDSASIDHRFAAAVASFGMLLRGSEYAGDAKFGDATAWAKAAIGEDEHGYRAEFVGLAEAATRLGD